MKQSNTQLKSNKADEDLKIIINSLKSNKSKEKILKLNKDLLVYGIVDFCKVTPTKAREYLMILQSRGILEMDRFDVMYNNVQNNQDECEQFFLDLKKQVLNGEIKK